jgi:hypothetical protein
MKIKQKLILSYLTISLLGAIAGYLGIKTLDKVQASFDRIAEQTIPVKNELNILEQTVDDLVYCTLEFILLNKNKDKFEESDSKLENRAFTVKTIETNLQEEIEEIEIDKKTIENL